MPKDKIPRCHPLFEDARTAGIYCDARDCLNWRMQPPARTAAWPRMPTLCGFRRRGYSPESIRKFVDKIGYTTYDALNDFALLESAPLIFP